jgi:hypothetical protein
MVNENTMWALYLLFHIWLSGSLLLPFMVLVRWGGTKWKGLYWLIGSRKRWLLIWGCYGLVMTIALAALRLVEFFPDYVPFDSLGWAYMPVWSALNALHIHTKNLLVEFLLGLSLRAFVEAAINCGFAAIGWWFYRWFTREAGAHRRNVAIERYGICLLLSACALGIANKVYSLLRPVTSSDFFSPHGIPFTYFHEGGFAGGEGFVWSGVMGDALVILLFGAILGWVWNCRKHSIVNGIII